MTESQDCYIILVQHKDGLLPVKGLGGFMRAWKTERAAKDASKAYKSPIILNIDSEV